MVVGLRLGLLVFPVFQGGLRGEMAVPPFSGGMPTTAPTLATILYLGRSVQVVPLRDTPQSRGLPGDRTGPVSSPPVQDGKASTGGG